ncbi:MAG: PEP-CTERM sorting domain-containing protein [Acidobacteriota bacterium]
MRRIFFFFIGFALITGSVLGGPITLSFTGLTDNTSGNNEPSIAGALATAAAAGLTLTQTGLAFNVGCGTGNTCLGADAVNVNDFAGLIRGVFAGDASYLAITFVNANAPPTVTTLFDSDNSVIAAFNNNFIYSGGSGLARRFDIQLTFDAFRTITFDLGAQTIPEPATALLIGAGLMALKLFRRRR